MQSLCAKLLTPNLHMLACVLTEQAKEVGDTVHFSELWVERMIQFVKQEVKYRSSGAPEKVIVSRMELSRCMKQLAESQPHILDDTADWLKLPLLGGAALVSSAPSECPPSSGGSHCEGKSRRVDARDGFLNGRLVIVQRMLDDMGHEPWDEISSSMVNVEAAEVRTYSRAVLRGQERLFSTEYTKCSVKDNTYVLIWYEGRPYVARVRQFLCIHPHGHPRALHMALVDYFHYRQPIQDKDLGTVYVVREGNVIPNETMYPVHLDSISCKLAYTRTTSQQGHKELLLAVSAAKCGSLVG